MSALLSCLPVLDTESGDVTAVIETPKGSRNKYDYDDGCAPSGSRASCPRAAHSRTISGSYLHARRGRRPAGRPGAHGRAGPGRVVLTIRLIGVIEAKQRKKGEDWIRNDRLLAVATHARTHEHVKDLDDLRPHLSMRSKRFSRTTTT